MRCPGVQLIEEGASSIAKKVEEKLPKLQEAEEAATTEFKTAQEAYDTKWPASEQITINDDRWDEWASDWQALKDKEAKATEATNKVSKAEKAIEGAKTSAIPSKWLRRIVGLGDKSLIAPAKAAVTDGLKVALYNALGMNPTVNVDPIAVQVRDNKKNKSTWRP